jgi:transposase
MSPPIHPEQLNALPPEFQALLRSIIDYYEAQLAELRAENAELQRQLRQKTPHNSSLPPSSQHPHAKPPPKKKKSPRKRGGQPGHPKHERKLIASEDCADVVTLLPPTCRGCGETLAGTDPAPLRHQVWDIPEIKPLVTEYQQHRLKCACGKTTCGALPTGVPQGQAGPRLIALTALLMGCFRQSKRRVALFMEQILNQPCSTGWVVKLQNQATAALRPAYDELAAELPAQAALGIDETPSKEGATKSWLWTCVAKTFSVFAIRPTRAASTLTELLTDRFPGIVNCDRARMYFMLPRVQWCWAHLKRDFQALVDSGDGVKKRLGHDLLRQTRKLFELWNRTRDGTLSRLEFSALLQPIRRAFEGLLLRGNFAGIAVAKELWRHRERLWTFVQAAGVEPTNNAAERALRNAVIWRKLSFGTQSAKGSRFVETLLTIVETCRQQARPLFDFLAQAVTAQFQQKPTPSLAGA